MDYCLKFESESAANAVLYTVGPVTVDEQGNTLESEARANYRNIDILGTLFRTPETEDAEPEAIPGWHVNVRALDGEDAAPLIPYIVTPIAPRRVWAGS